MSWRWDELPETDLTPDFEPGDCADGYASRQVEARRRGMVRKGMPSKSGCLQGRARSASAPRSLKQDREAS